MLSSRFHACVLFAAFCFLGGCSDSFRDGQQSIPPGLRALRVLGCDQGLRVEFSIDVDAATVSAETFLVERATGTVSYDSAGRTATYVPLDPFTSGELYTAVLTQGITTTAGDSLPEPLRWQFTCVDRAPPVLIERAPLGNDQSLLARPTLRFSKPLDEATLTPDNIHIVGVESRLEWDAAERTVTLVPVRPLYPGRSYSVVVSAKVRDLSGNALGTDVAWTFRTRRAFGDWTARLVSPAVPGATACDAPIELRIAPHVEVEEEAFVSPPVLIDGAPGSSAQWDETARILRIWPTAPLRAGARFALVATAAFKDRLGDVLFDDGAIIEELEVVADCELPTVETVPAAWGTVGCDAALELRFSQEMTQESLEGAVSLRDLVAGGWKPDTSPVVASELVASEDDASIFYLQPLQPLENGRRYWLSVSDHAESLGGDPLTLPGGWEVLAVCE